MWHAQQQVVSPHLFSWQLHQDDKSGRFIPCCTIAVQMKDDETNVFFFTMLFRFTLLDLFNGVFFCYIFSQKNLADSISCCASWWVTFLWMHLIWDKKKQNTRSMEFFYGIVHFTQGFSTFRILARVHSSCASIVRSGIDALIILCRDGHANINIHTWTLECYTTFQ